MTELSERVARLEADVTKIKRIFKIDSIEVIGKILKEHPEIKTASEARDFALKNGIGSKEDLEIFDKFDFGTNTGGGGKPHDKEKGGKIVKP